MKNRKIWKTLVVALVFGLVMASCGEGGGQGARNRVRHASINAVIDASGLLWVWGNNHDGQLGDGTTESRNRASPARIEVDGGWATVSRRSSRTVAIRADGSLWAWGDNRYGGVGDGTGGDWSTRNNRHAPVRIMDGAYDWVSVSVGGLNTMAIRKDGTLWAWGSNLGDGTETRRNAPVRIGSATNWAFVSAGALHTMAIKTDGTLWAWGNNEDGALGVGRRPDAAILGRIVYTVPTQVGTDTNWAYVSAGRVHTVALRTDGSLWAWGANAWGQLGDGTTRWHFTPVQIGTDNWVSVSTTSGGGGIGNHTVAVRADGTLWAWGNNAYGQLGDNTETDRIAPVQIGTATNWASAYAGGTGTVATRTDGSLWAWGGGGGHGLARSLAPVQFSIR